MDRRTFLRTTVGMAGVAALAPSVLRRAPAAPAVPGPSPYGALAAAPDANGLLLPPGFTSRVVARAGQTWPGSAYAWHTDPDGGAVFPMADGGWVYASNKEERLNPTGGGAGALRFDAQGKVIGAYSILTGTYTNCAGGPTPWGTWLSCEEHPLGQVWECDPTKPGQGVPRPALGRFWHEAVTVDPVRKQLYLTEDAWNGQDGRFYRFTPTTYPNLSAGVLEAARVQDEAVTWVPVDTTAPVTAATVPQATVFKGAEGVWFADGVVFFTTKTDNRVWRYDVAASRMTVLYDAAALADAPLTGVDNCVVSRAGELFVAEDGGDMELVVVAADGAVAPFLRLTGQDGSELSGPAFDPSGTRLFFTSMRGPGGEPSSDGFVYEVRGPFRLPEGGATGDGADGAADRSGGADTAATAAVAGVREIAAAPVGESGTLPATGGHASGLLGLGLLAAAGAAAGLGRAAASAAEEA